MVIVGIVCLCLDKNCMSFGWNNSRTQLQIYLNSRQSVRVIYLAHGNTSMGVKVIAPLGYSRQIFIVQLGVLGLVSAIDSVVFTDKAVSEDSQFVPFVGVYDNAEYLRYGNVKFNDQLLRLGYREESEYCAYRQDLLEEEGWHGVKGNWQELMRLP
jgi:hypothetical protein